MNEEKLKKLGLMMKFSKAALVLNLIMMANAAHAFVMPDTGLTLVILYVNDGDIFDFSSVEIQSSGYLDVYGNTPNASFSIVSASDFILNGHLNLYVSKTSFVSDSFYVSGSVFVQQGGQISFTAPNMTFTNTSTITVEGGNILLTTPSIGVPSGGIVIKDAGILNPKPIITISAVPEPESYALLLAGLGLIGVIRRRQLV